MTERTKPAPEIRVGERFVRQVSLTAEEISTFARMSGDLNPLHHDEDFARQTRFGGIIASASHITALMIGFTAAHFSVGRSMVGLEFSFRFNRAVKAGENFEMGWEVIIVEPNQRLQGHILTLEGKVVDSEKEELPYVTGLGKILVVEKL